MIHNGMPGCKPQDRSPQQNEYTPLIDMFPKVVTGSIGCFHHLGGINKDGPS